MDKKKRHFTKKEKREIDKLVKMDVPRWLAEDTVYIKQLGLDKIEPSRAVFFSAVAKCLNTVENLEKKSKKLRKNSRN